MTKIPKKQTQKGDIRLNTKEVALLLHVYELDLIRAIREKKPINGIILPDPIVLNNAYLFDYEEIISLTN